MGRKKSCYTRKQRDQIKKLLNDPIVTVCDCGNRVKIDTLGLHMCGRCDTVYFMDLEKLEQCLEWRKQGVL